MNLIVHRLMFKSTQIGYRIDIGADKCDMTITLFNEFYNKVYNPKIFSRGSDIAVHISNDCYVSDNEKDVSYAHSMEHINYLCKCYRFCIYKYKVVDCSTHEIVIETSSKDEVKVSIKDWLVNNPDALIAVYEDGKSVYP